MYIWYSIVQSKWKSNLKKLRKSPKLDLDFFFMIFYLQQLPLEGKKWILLGENKVGFTETEMGLEGWMSVGRQRRKALV